jgi:hypothetical protein
MTKVLRYKCRESPAETAGYSFTSYRIENCTCQTQKYDSFSRICLLGIHHRFNKRLSTELSIEYSFQNSLASFQPPLARHFAIPSDTMSSHDKFRDYYADLNLQLGATLPQIKSAYQTLVLLTHPDKTGNPDATAFRIIHEAYKLLSDDEFRTAYDKSYWSRKLHTDPPGTENFTRTAEYEAEERRRRARSPPPKQPAQKYHETSYMYFFGKPYLAWQKRMNAWRARHPEWVEK